MSQEEITELFKKALEQTVTQSTPKETKYELKVQEVRSEEIIKAREKGMPAEWIGICENLVDKKWYVVRRLAIN